MYYIIDKLITAVQEKKKVSFQYGEYDINKNFVRRNDGEIYINSPYGCLWNDDFYYLIGYSEKRKKVVTFRVDRIVELEVLNDDIIPEPEGFTMANYAKTCIEMYDGKLQEVDLLCDNELMKHVIDKFGDSIKVKKVSEEQFRATVNVATSKTFYAWCFRFAGQMKIVAPINVKTQYVEMANMILKNI